MFAQLFDVVGFIVFMHCSVDDTVIDKIGFHSYCCNSRQSALVVFDDGFEKLRADVMLCCADGYVLWLRLIGFWLVLQLRCLQVDCVCCVDVFGCWITQ